MRMSSRERFYGFATTMLLIGVLAAPIAGQSGFDWLINGIHPRCMALAGAAIATGDPNEALGMNPAGLWRGETGVIRDISWSWARFPAHLSQHLVTLALPAGSQQVGWELRYFDFGSFEGYDEDGNPTDSYSAADILLRGGLARSFGSRFVMGTAVGLISSSIESVSATALLWSLGTQIHLPKQDAHLGLVFQNQGWIMRDYDHTSSSTTELPSLMLVGVSKSLAHLPLTLHLSGGKRLSSGAILWRLGGEFQLPGQLALRFGVDESKLDYVVGAAYPDLLAGFSLGVGLRVPGPGEWFASRETGSGTLRLDTAVKFLCPLGMVSALALGTTF